MSLQRTSPDSIDWDTLSHESIIVNGHVEASYDATTNEWTDPVFVEDPILRIHGLSPALNYGQQAYEGLKAYRAPNDAIHIFRPEHHAARLQHSASVISVPAPPAHLFTASIRLAVHRNAEYVPPHASNALLYIRPILFGGSDAQLGLVGATRARFCVYVVPVRAYHGTAPLAALILEAFDRAAPRGTGSAKVGGNYAPVIRWSEAAKREGYAITLHLDSRTHSEIEEFSTSAFAGFKIGPSGICMVVPESPNIVDSVTSDSCREVARSLGWAVERRTILYEELGTFVEVAAMGTAAAVVPIKSITCKSKGDVFEYKVNTADYQSYSLKLASHLLDIQKGSIRDQYNWCVSV